MGPDLILADEPTANLDSATGRTVIEQLAEAAKAFGAAVVIVTHDSRLDGIADRVLHLEDGPAAQRCGVSADQPLRDPGDPAVHVPMIWLYCHPSSAGIDTVRAVEQSGSS